MINNLCKLALEHGGFVQELVIPGELSNGTGLTNPSLIIEDGKYILNLRHVQYSLYHSEGEQKYQTAWGPLTYFNPEDDVTLRTKNYMCELDQNTLAIKSYTVTDTSKLDVKPLWEFIGLEDVRLVRWDNKLYQSGVRRDTTTNGVGRMELSEIVDNKEISRLRITPPADTYCEKNWMPILDMPYHYVKWTNSTEIVKLDITTKKAETVKLVEQKFNFPRDLRGGSQVLKYKDYYIALTHEVDLWKNYLDRKDAQYYHRFVVWDHDWNIVHFSQEFKFIDSNIEFSCGLAIDGDSMLIPFGIQDSTAFIVKFPLDLFEYLVGIKEYLIDVKPYNKSDHLIESYVQNPNDTYATFSIANRYYKDLHYASALSFYLKTAERSSNQDLTYSSLVLVAKCIAKLGRREHAESIAYFNAISFLPTRPEAYYNLSVYYELKKEYHNAYMHACMGLQYSFTCKSNDLLDYPGEFALYFQKAVSAWFIGKRNESAELFRYLYSKYNLPEYYKNIVKNNLNYIDGDKSNILEEFPMVNCSSLSTCEDRRNYLDERFKEYNFDKINYHIYNKYNPGDYKLKGNQLERLKESHIAITISHILTIKTWYDTTDEAYGFFCEDDISLETLQYWKFTWKEFMQNLPADWEAVQLCLISENDREIKFTKRISWDWGGQAYILKREYAKKLLDAHYNDGTFDFTIPGLDFVPCVEHMLFDGIGIVYNFPLFVENLNFTSTYSEERPTNQRGYNHVINYWKTNNFSPESMLNL